jgi:peptide/nickel transport system permease protein
MTATLRHARYVLSENPVTAFAFALFFLLALCAALGPALVPFDPLASATAEALTGPSTVHWFGTDQLGRDIFSRIVVATRLDLGIAVTSVALAFGIGTLLGLAAGYCAGHWPPNATVGHRSAN